MHKATARSIAKTELSKRHHERHRITEELADKLYNDLIKEAKEQYDTLLKEAKAKHSKYIEEEFDRLWKLYEAELEAIEQQYPYGPKTIMGKYNLTKSKLPPAEQS